MKNYSIKKVKSEKGQMAIFVALIFQVLFVFFAMSINVALIVHDKINLQNSVDLAAYYAAQRQAEVLNAIAHQNYQIRQGWKLLTWRSRVLGSQGYIQPDPHPLNPAGGNGDIREREFRSAGLGTNPDPLGQPSICIGYGPTFYDIDTNQSLCKNKNNQRIEKFNEVPVLAPWLPIAVILNQQSIKRRQQFDESCNAQGMWNWWYAHAIMHSFRVDQSNRRKVIAALANGLSGDGSGDFTDLNGQSVLFGASKVINKNLTHSNFGSSGAEIQIYNSFTGLSSSNWLKPISVRPRLRYLDQYGDASACNSAIKNYEILPETQAGQDFNFIMNDLGTNAVFGYSRSSGPVDQQLALGVEKNPWYMGYVAIKATTQSRQIFHPFGDPITITAKAFAKPFGGSIGPSYGSAWPNSSDVSTGPKIDKLVPDRFTGNASNPNSFTNIPNYSRFPGDKLGLASRLSQGALASGGANSFNAFKGKRRQYFLSYRDYEANTVNDPLPWDYDTDQAPPSRAFELAAISPDLFDVSYYSIDPDYWSNYGSRIQANRNALGIPGDVPIRGDLGSRGNDMKSIRDQFRVGKQYHRKEAFYFIRDLNHLLTSWVQQDSVLEYTTDPTQTQFGKCLYSESEIAGQLQKVESGVYPPIQGGCVAGGRTGYSVKIVSEDFLRSADLELGGEGQTGAILNQPPADF